jgi:hypothetical protein
LLDKHNRIEEEHHNHGNYKCIPIKCRQGPAFTAGDRSLYWNNSSIQSGESILS